MTYITSNLYDLTSILGYASQARKKDLAMLIGENIDSRKNVKFKDKNGPDPITDAEISIYNEVLQYMDLARIDPSLAEKVDSLLSSRGYSQEEPITLKATLTPRAMMEFHDDSQFGTFAEAGQPIITQYLAGMKDLVDNPSQENLEKVRYLKTAIHEGVRMLNRVSSTETYHNAI